MVFMKRLPSALALVAILPALVSAQQAPSGPGSSDDAAKGKAIFIAHGCATCHDDDAAKRLDDGTTLLSKLAQSKDPESRLATRLKNQQERHQAMLYIRSLLKRRS